MSNEDDLISSLYPPPPPFVKFFTEENLAKLQEWKDQQSQQQQEEDPDDKKDGSSVPPKELQFLVPPAKPAGTQYRGYGNIWSFEDKLPNLKDTQWTQLYQDDASLTSESKIQELHKIMDSLLLNFLDLVGLLSVDPGKFEPKIQDISLLLINFNHLLNTYRPHQSRESLIMLLKKQIGDKQREIEEVDRVCGDVRSKIKSLVADVAMDAVSEPEIEAREEVEEIKRTDVVSDFLQSL
ncbi:uncharacterized protein LODBEIA_P23540 [Lodderomyces beijingensis]|uniref:Mediator of RNA polymerase II transcription subunit 7 n=1 Tax=Lodderomyces beijingensis TaxID=1775926 RepID=A0ABP0ZPJ4_9ASCO